VNQITTSPKRVVVIGGGISGLAAAHRLRELDPACQVTLLEAGSRLGGVLETARRDGFLIERSADNFITNVPWAVDLCRRVGLGDQLLPTSSEQRNAMVVYAGRLERVPQGFMLMAPARLGPVLATPILSPWGKLRLLGEYFVPRRTDGADESLASFARRRLGREAFERIVQPLVGGIYAADPERLSLAATMPRFVEMERRWGGLIRGARHERSSEPADATSDVAGARYGMFVTPRDGLSSLVAAIAAKLPEGSVRLGARVESLSRGENGGWVVKYAVNDGTATALECDAVIIAIGAPDAARLLAPIDKVLAGELAAIEYAGTSIVCLAFRRDQVTHPLDGFGFVVPAIEKRPILAGSFSSVKFAGRAPQDRVLIRVFIGGACQSELAELGDHRLRQIALDELRSLIGARGEPLFADIARWPRSMPQYHLGHCQRVERIEAAVGHLSGLALAGNAYHGVGIPNCIHSGEMAAEGIGRMKAEG
jgi:oxygen-dependent protoporphyrinogen oxidase